MTDETDVSVEDVAALLERGDRVQLVDVRGPWEAEIASLPGSILIPLGSIDGRLGELDPDVPVVTYCHHGMRSEDPPTGSAPPASRCGRWRRHPPVEPPGRPVGPPLLT